MLQASVREGSLQVARRRQGVRSVVGRLLGRDERAHGLVHDRALGALGRREQAGHHAAAGPSDAGRFAQRPPRVAGELERVDADHRVERGVAIRQGLHVAFAQVGRGSRSRAMPSRPGLMSRPLGVAPRWAASTSVSPDPQPTSSTRVPGPTPAASSTASNSGRLCASARSAHARGSVPHRRRWTSAAALIAVMPRRGLDVLVELEDVIRVVDRLDSRQALDRAPVRARGRVVLVVAHEVDVVAFAQVRLDGGVGRAGPGDLALVVGGVAPGGRDVDQPARLAERERGRVRSPPGRSRRPAPAAPPGRSATGSTPRARAARR